MSEMQELKVIMAANERERLLIGLCENERTRADAAERAHKALLGACEAELDAETLRRVKATAGELREVM